MDLFKVINDLYLFGLNHIKEGLIILWCIAIFVYVMKLFIPQWDYFTRFGKLEVGYYSIPSISYKLGWGLFYSFSILMFFVTWIIKFPPKIASILLFCHSSRRFIETLLVTKFTSRRMHFINFLAGLLFYFMSPFSITVENLISPLRSVKMGRLMVP